MSRPTHEEFHQWLENDCNISKISQALTKYPELVDIKYNVSFNRNGNEKFIQLMTLYSTKYLIIVSNISNNMIG